MNRSTFPLVYQGHNCLRHRSVARLVETDECVECVGPQRMRELQDAEERRQKARRVHRLLHELSDAGQTILELARTTGMPTAQVRGLLEELAALGLVAFGEERFGHHSRWLWSRLPPSARRSSLLPDAGPRAKSVLYG
ncbi:MAG TPA: helix-turn-helix domain-containing protein [Myxococcaceae bacterium]|nr:helix-turn-helix domain-containing protein [Myxococcaceae bacterium]